MALRHGCDRQWRGLGRDDGSHAHPESGRRQTTADHPDRAMDGRGTGTSGLTILCAAAFRIAASDGHSRYERNADSATAGSRPVTVKPEQAKVSVYFNVDNGSGK